MAKVATAKEKARSALLATFSKRHRANMEVRPEDPMTPAEAIATLKKFKMPKFDQTVNVVVFLGIDTKQAEQNIRGSVALPKGIGKSKRVVAFCADTVVKDALAAGAIKAGGEELAKEVEKGWMDFDVAVASPDMMRVISKLGRVLGPKGLMPSPKAGTVTPDIPTAVKEYSAGKVEYRNDKGGNIHAVIGKMSFSATDLTANLNHFIHTIEASRPSTVKGHYIKKVAISGVMTPSVLVAVQNKVVE
ncbi:MAG TPA: 50S ribosomal protein L1 [Phycisphaerales bacterium]|nr:50S ribosomal protein L1 [Phycisphaerales bacterium]